MIVESQLKNFLMACYYSMAALAFVVLANDVLILRWHSWDRHLFFVLPIGEWIGWAEVVLFSGLAGFSAFMAIKKVLEVGGYGKGKGRMGDC